MKKNFPKIDIDVVMAALDAAPVEITPASKGAYFRQWYQDHHKEIEGPVLKALSGDEKTIHEFDRRVELLMVVTQVDELHGSRLAKMGFTHTEKTNYARSAINKRIVPLGFIFDGSRIVHHELLTHEAGE